MSKLHSDRPSKSKNTAACFIWGLLLGAAAGTAAGLLLAPSSGSDTLAKIKSKVTKTHDQAEKVMDQGSTQIKTQSSDLLSLISAKLALVRQAFVAGKQAALAKHEQLSQLEDSQLEARHG